MLFKIIKAEIGMRLGIDKTSRVFDEEIVEEQKRVRNCLEKKEEERKISRDYFEEQGISKNDLGICDFQRRYRIKSEKRM